MESILLGNKKGRRGIISKKEKEPRNRLSQTVEINTTHFDAVYLYNANALSWKT